MNRGIWRKRFNYPSRIGISRILFELYSGPLAPTLKYINNGQIFGESETVATKFMVNGRMYMTGPVTYTEQGESGKPNWNGLGTTWTSINGITSFASINGIS